MALKKSELYTRLWQMCDELRGGMDASQYKDYVLVLLFIKYVSDRHAGKKNSLITIPPGGSYADIVALKGDKNIGEKIDIAISKLAEANDLKGVINVADFNDPGKLGADKEMVDRLSKLVAIFEDLDFASNRAEGDDLLGDAYEYLMRNFATESGKSKGQFYTPAEVSRVMAKVIGLGSATSPQQSIYDPTCGSGSLLLKAHDEAKSATGLDLALYGQEMDNATSALAKMNMILHECARAVPDIYNGNTLANPWFKSPNGGLKTFDFIVANPPFSTKAWSNGIDPANDRYGRFAYGVPPAKNGDYAFLLHILASLKSTGKAAVILPHGVLFRGNAEADIRRELIKRGFIKAIIGLPANLFYGTGIPAAIIVLDKGGAGARKGIFMMDASKGFIKDGNKNRLREQDIHKIVDTHTRLAEVPRYARLVPVAEIADAKNDYNLNLPRYIDSTEPEDLQDIDAHLRGGIPNRDLDALDAYWTVLPSLRATLFKKGNRTGYSDLKLPIDEVKPAIFGHAEFTSFNESVTKLFAKWRKSADPQLKAFTRGDRPKLLVEGVSEELLANFRAAPLLDAYDVYQHFMDYWAATMQDDCYLIAAVGWKAGATPREIFQVKNKDKKLVWREEHDFKRGKRRFKSDLIPAALLIDRYFGYERDEIAALEAELARIEQQLDEKLEDGSGEEGLLAEVIEGEGDKQKITPKAVKTRIKDIGDDSDFVDERKALEDYAALLDQQADTKARLKAARDDLDAKLDAKYPTLTEGDIKTVVVDDKWLGALTAAVRDELDRVSRTLTGRIRQLAHRYETPMPKLACDVGKLAHKVNKHLLKMGAVWK